jgi:hypothetical protein
MNQRRTETESSLWNDFFSKKIWTMDNVQRANYCTNKPSPTTFRSYKRRLTFNGLHGVIYQKTGLVKLI